MQFPVTLNFKILALAPQIFVRDATGAEFMYVKQKLFKLREAINVFADQSQADQRYTIQADRIIDFSAQYNFTDHQGMSIGSIKRQGMRSLWKAHYDVAKNSSVAYNIQEENPFVKFMDAFFGEIPIVGMLSGYIFNPVYLVTPAGDEGNVLVKITKRRSFLESNFTIEEVNPAFDDDDGPLLLLSIITMVLLERQRG